MGSRNFGSIENDRVYVDRVLAGDETVFNDIVKVYKKHVYYLAVDLSNNHDDAEDITQEVFIRVYKSLKNFRGDSKLSTWLYRITVNCFINRTRTLAYEYSKTRAQHDEEIADHTGSYTVTGGNPEHEANMSLLEEQLQVALQTLSPQQRTVFTLRHYHGMALKEIAETLGNTEGTVKVLLFRAVHNLQKKLAHFKDY